MDEQLAVGFELREFGAQPVSSQSYLFGDSGDIGKHRRQNRDPPPEWTGGERIIPSVVEEGRKHLGRRSPALIGEPTSPLGLVKGARGRSDGVDYGFSISHEWGGRRGRRHFGAESTFYDAPLAGKM